MAARLCRTTPSFLCSNLHATSQSYSSMTIPTTKAAGPTGRRFSPRTFSQSSTVWQMPFNPSAETFISEGLNKRATFFGCNATDKITIVYLPNNDYTLASNTSTYQLEYSETETDEMVANGVEIATQGGDYAWGTCLGCAIMMKTGQSLPNGCTACFSRYCYCDWGNNTAKW